MVQFSRWLLVGALCSAGMVLSARAADPFVGSPETPDKRKTSDKTSEVVLSASNTETCADGKCSANGACGKEKKQHNKLNALGRWLFYHPVFVGCEGRFPEYRPPLYVFCLDLPCGSSIYPRTSAAPIPMTTVVKKTEPMLPKPEMPKMAQKEKPLVPGSSTAMSDKKETAEVVVPANYKLLPIRTP